MHFSDQKNLILTVGFPVEYGLEYGTMNLSNFKEISVFGSAMTRSTLNVLSWVIIARLATLSLSAKEHRPIGEIDQTIHIMSLMDPVKETDSIISICETVMAHPDLGQLPDTLMFLLHFHYGCAQQFKSEYQTKLDALLRADSILDIIADKRFVHQYKPKITFNFGVTYNSLRNYEKALSYFLKLRTVYAGQIDEQLLGKCYGGEAVSYKRLRSFDLAEESYLKAVNIFKKLKQSAKVDLAVAYNNLGMFYKDVRQDHDLAIEYFNESCRIYYAELDTFNERLITPTTLIGVAYCQQKLLDKALPYFAKAERIMQKVCSPDNIQLPIFYGDLAICYLNNDQFTEALENFKYALTLLHYDHEDPFYSHFSPHPYLPMNTLAWTHWAYQRKYDELQDQNALDSAITYAEYTLDMMEALVESYQLDLSQSILLEEKTWVFNNYILDLWRKWEQTSDEYLIHQSLLVIDRVKNMKYRDHMWKRSSINQNISQEDRDRAFALKEKISLVSKDIEAFNDASQGGEADSLLAYQAEKAMLKNTYEDILNTSTSKYLKKQIPFPSWSEIKERGPDHKSAWIVYFHRGDHYAVITLTKDSVWMEMLAPPRRQVFEQVRTNLTNVSLHIEDDHKMLDSLTAIVYDSLIRKPLAHLHPSIKNIHIGLDGMLSHIPFESITMGSTAQSGYMVEAYNISYFTEVASTLSTPVREIRKVAIFAPKYQLDQVDTTQDLALAQLVRAGNYNLPGAEQEAHDIIELTHGQLFSGMNASETTFKKNAGDFDVLHLSMHGIVDDRYPFLSRLLFDTNIDTLNDGQLHVSEIHQLDLNAQMVVLSACNTGYGKISKGEGVVSIAQSFQYAGVPTSVMSLWTVPDHSTRTIMREFYSGLSQGLTKDVALAQAKRNFLASVSDPRVRHPYYWAGFVLQGNTSSLQFVRAAIWPPLIIIAVIAGFLWLLWKSRNAS